MVLQWIDRVWREIPVDLITRLFKSCGVNNALDGTEDDLVWDNNEEEEAEDEEEPRTTSSWDQPSFQTNGSFQSQQIR